MTSPSFDPIQYKEAQRQEWDSVAEGWHKWWPVLERGAQSVSDRLVELTQVRESQRVLDIATGIGEPAVTAARRVGASGRVTATDQSPGMLQIARERVEAAGLTNVDFAESDVDALAFSDAPFDAILCRWGLMFVPNLNETLTAIRGWLAPGGRFATAVWAEPQKVPMVSLAFGVIPKVLGSPPPPPPPGAPSLFKLAPDGVLASAFGDAGFADVQTETVNVAFELSSPEDYSNFLKDIAPPIIALTANLSPAKQDEFWSALAEAAKRFANADGSLIMPNETILVSGRA
jgi:ubiquinone/menaquinone biosynthesis C-methylase UbiE